MNTFLFYYSISFFQVKCVVSLCSIMLTENLKCETVLRLPDVIHTFDMGRLFVKAFLLENTCCFVLN